MPLTEDVTPKCPDCMKILDWRDAAYVLGSNLCKRCHQREQRAREKGTFTPTPKVQTSPASRRSGRHISIGELTAPWRPQMRRGMKTRKQVRKAQAAA